jgi:alpha-galactosidase
MSFYLCALSAKAPFPNAATEHGDTPRSRETEEHVARFVRSSSSSHIWEASLPTGERFFLQRDSAASRGAPGHDIWTLRALRQSLVSGRPWAFQELKISELPLHPGTEAVAAGGWQCWSESPLVGRGDVLRAEAFPERAVFGDDALFRYPERRGEPHAWSFSTSQVEGGTRNGLFGAFDEDLFFTRFEFNLPLARYAVAFDTAGAAVETLRTLHDRGTNDITLGAWLAPCQECADFAPLHCLTAAWMALVRAHSRTPRALAESEQAARRVPLRGYTSWYLHYNAITEDVLRQNVDAFSTVVTPQDAHAKVFQVDDGYQARIGDWLTPAPGFPGGVAKVAAWAREKGLEPGIWCAPFIATENSRAFAEHPEWVLRDAEGQPVLCGNHPLWGGRFFALDTENPKFLAHLEKVFETFFKEWGFRFLKADFLYATARVPAGGLTRAQRSARAHEFLYAACLKHGAKLLSCGAPLASAYLRCDYSRIGADVGETWENSEFGTAPSREKVSTRGTLVNTLTRSALSGIAFGNDPDVCILRENAQKMSRSERELLAEINFTLGDLVFTSDDVSTWSPWAAELFARLAKRADAKKAQGCKVASVRLDPHGLYAVEFDSHTSESLPSSLLLVNLDDAPRGGVLPHGFLWQQTSTSRNEKAHP